VQTNILEANPSADLRVYVVWLPILRKDSLSSAAVSRALMPDDRVIHLWNDDRSIGLWFKQNVTPEYRGKVLWDAYLLYDEKAKWVKIPEPMVGWGRTVIGQSKKLKQHLYILFGE